MTPKEQAELGKVIAEGLNRAHKEESPINPQNIFYALGVAAVLYVGYSFDSTVQANADKLDALTEAVGKLVLVSENQQQELSRRGLWMDNVDTYSEQSRIHDERHDAAIENLERRVMDLERN